jgi:hypothetical protein
MAVIVLSLMTLSCIQSCQLRTGKVVDVVEYETGCTFLRVFFFLFLLICISSVLYSSMQPCYICSNFSCKDCSFTFVFENLSPLIILRLENVFHHAWLEQ